MKVSCILSTLLTFHTFIRNVHTTLAYTRILYTFVYSQFAQYPLMKPLIEYTFIVLFSSFFHN